MVRTKRKGFLLWLALVCIAMASCNSDGNSGGNAPSTGLASESTASYRVDIYDPTRAWNGTTLTVDISDPARTRFVEIDQEGNIIYEYVPDVGEPIGSDIEPGPEEGQFMMLLQDRIRILDVKKEALGDGNAIRDILLPGRPSHDVDIDRRQGTFLVNYGSNDPDPRESYDLYHVLELDNDGDEVWRWNAYEAGITEEYFPRYNTTGGYYHCNAVHRYYEGEEMRTMISVRNFNLFVVVDESGTILETYDSTLTGTGEPEEWEVPNQVDPHDPHLLSDGRWLVCLQRTSAYDVALVTESGTVEEGFAFPGISCMRDADPLPNGNTLCQALVELEGTNYSTLFEYAPDGTIVWQVVNERPVEKGPGYFYKAHRCPEGKGPAAYRTAALLEAQP